MEVLIYCRVNSKRSTAKINSSFFPLACLSFLLACSGNQPSNNQPFF